MRPFEGFKRQAIVIVPTDEEFRRRIAQREKEEGKEVPESAVLEMKGSFSLFGRVVYRTGTFPWVTFATSHTVW